MKKAALFEQSIAESLFDHHPIMNTTKATPDHHKCEFAAFRLSKFFLLPAPFRGLGRPTRKAWGVDPQKALPARRFSGRVFGPPDALLVGCKSRSPQGETLHLPNVS